MERPFAAYNGDGPYVFVCYAHKDAAQVYPELVWLRSQGVDIWYDEGISPGEEWSEELGRAITNARKFLYFVTQASVTSRSCRDEVHFAKNRGTPMLAVHLERTTLPAGLELAIGASQAILKADLSEAAFRTKLLSALQKETPGARATIPTPPLRGSKPASRRWIAGAIVVVLATLLAAWWASRPSTEPSAPERSIAVLPFTTVESDPSVRAYTTGLSEELRGVVAQYQELTTVDAGAAAYTVGGSTQREGDRLRVRLELNRTRGQQTVWSAALERQFASADAAPSALARTIGRFVRLELVKDWQCESVKRKAKTAEGAAAVCAALAEDYKINQGGARDPQQQLLFARQATRLEPHLAVAHVLLADAHWFTTGQWEPYPYQVAFERALALDPNDFRVLLALGSRQTAIDLDYTTAERTLRKALELDPSHPNARWCHAAMGDAALHRGDVAAALTNYRRAVRIYDADARIYSEFANVLNIAGQHREALDAVREGLELVSGGDLLILFLNAKVRAHVALGELAEANRAIDTFAVEHADLAISLYTALAVAGRAEEARSLVRQLEAQQNAQTALPGPAVAYGLIGESSAAFASLHEAIDTRIPYVLRYLRTSPVFDPLRADPRWAEVMQHLEAEEAKGRARNANASS